MTKNYLHFTELEVYKECRLLRKSISNIVKFFPAEEKYRLIGQVLRSSRGITACIAEGYGRYYYKENIQYCRISRGSLYETYEHLLTALDEKYIESKTLDEFKIKIDACGRLLNGYINYLKKTRYPKEED
jgi:four helix bundle protein